MRKLLLVVVFWVLCLYLIAAPGNERMKTGQNSSNVDTTTTSLGNLTPGSGADVDLTLRRMPLYFIANKGQVDKSVAFYVQGQGISLLFGAGGMTAVLYSKTVMEEGGGKEQLAAGSNPRSWVIKTDFVDANPGIQPVGHSETGAVISYFKGKPEDWHTGIPTYSRIVYRNLWPGIDLVYSGDFNRLKGEFFIRPGADPSLIRLAYRGATSIRLNEMGQLEAETPVGPLVDDVPVAYQEISGRKVEVPIRYKLDDTAKSRVCSFHLEKYDPAFSLVIDPVVFVYANMFGGQDEDIPFGICVDKSKNAYVAGLARSILPAVPASVGPGVDDSGHPDAFIAKINASGTALIYCAYLGGTDINVCHGLAVDDAESAYITGYTYSKEDTFPVKSGPGLALKGQSDAFIAKIDASGTGLLYCGYIGGSEHDIAYDIAIDRNGNAYITGETFSSEETFPVVAGPDLTHNDRRDTFIAKVNASGTELMYCGYIGGELDDTGFGVAVDDEGNSYVTGQTDSAESSFPVRGGPDLTFNNRGRRGTDAFVAKINPSGEALVYCGYIGGAGSDSGRAIAVDSSGNAFITGETNSAEDSFPVRIGPNHRFKGKADAFIAKLNPSGSRLIYCGYIGGSDSDGGNGVAVSAAGNAYVTGYTYSNENSFPVALGPDLTYNGKSDAFVAKVNILGSRLDYCTYLGGGDDEIANGIALDSLGNAYITGWTQSRRVASAVSGSSSLPGPLGSSDGFIAKIFSADVLPIFGGTKYSGGKAADIAVWRPSDGNWYIKDSPKINFGLPGDIPVPGDYDGDGKTDVAVYRPSTGLWFIKNQFRFTRGPSGDIPVPGDYDGDGKTDIAIYRASAGMWIVEDQFTEFLGTNGDIPVPGDYDGDGKTDIAVFNALTGHWRVKGQFHAYLGVLGDIPVPADYNGDKKCDIAIFRPQEGLWMVKDQFRVNFGTAGDIPVPGDYDGNGTADIAVFRPSIGLWAVKDQFQVFFGKSGDIPLVR